MRSIQHFKALRETAGLTQQGLARALGIRERSIQRWESPYEPQEPNEGAWGVVEEAVHIQDRGIQEALRVYDILTEDIEVQEVVLPYWTSDEDYMTYSTDSTFGLCANYREANAGLRALATVLRLEGQEVRFTSGKEWRETYATG